MLEKTLDSLRSEIQTKFRAELSVKRHFVILTNKINEEIKTQNISIKHKKVDDISFQTIARIWGYIEPDNMNKVKGRESNLSLLAEVLGYDGWNDFCAKHAESDPVIDEEQLPPLEYAYPDLHLNHLSNDEEITIGFPPLKYCILKKLDDGEFEVVEQKGMFNQKGTILYIEKIVMERGTQKNAFPEIKYEYLPNVEDEDENGIIPESLYIPRSL